jgi:hypothetical protein
MLGTVGLFSTLPFTARRFGAGGLWLQLTALGLIQGALAPGQAQMIRAVRALYRGRLSGLSISHSKSVLYGASAMYGRAGRLTAQNGGFRPGQWMPEGIEKVWALRTISLSHQSTDILGPFLVPRLMTRGFGSACRILSGACMVVTVCWLALARNKPGAPPLKVKFTELTQTLQVDAAVFLKIPIRVLELAQILGQPCEFQVLAAAPLSAPNKHLSNAKAVAKPKEKSVEWRIFRVPAAQARKTPSWPRSWANFSPL